MVVVVTALGIKKAEKSLGYSLQQVNSDAFDKVKTDNPINALNGKVAGLTVNTRAGILEDPPIKLRGETPIYVINGTPVTYYRGVSSDDIEPVDMGNYDTFDVDKGREIFELGYKSTMQLLETKMK
jgi:hypothetical protein